MSQMNLARESLWWWMDQWGWRDYVINRDLLFYLGGLFGSSTFSQPVTSSTSSGFGFGATTGGTSNSLFGSTNTGGGGLFSQQGNAFSASKPASFGSKFSLINSVRSYTGMWLFGICYYIVKSVLQRLGLVPAVEGCLGQLTPPPIRSEQPRLCLDPLALQLPSLAQPSNLT